MYYINLFLITFIILLIGYISYTRRESLDEDYAWFYYIAIIIGSLAVLSPLFISYHFRNDETKMGPTGDWLSGSMTPFLTLATFIILLATFKQQRKELELAKKDSEDQHNTSEIQRFENTFFQLISTQNEIVKAIEVAITNIRPRTTNSPSTWVKETFTGRNALSYLYNSYKNLQHSCDLTIEDRIHEIKITYKDWYSHNEHHIGHYYRSLYHIYNLINSSQIEDKYYYAKLLRAQLSKAELLLLFYNSIAFQDDNKFIPLIHRYKLLKHINMQELVCPSDEEILKREYPNTFLEA